jgi:hypothetical protein
MSTNAKINALFYNAFSFYFVIAARVIVHRPNRYNYKLLRVTITQTGILNLPVEIELNLENLKTLRKVSLDDG